MKSFLQGRKTSAARALAVPPAQSDSLAGAPGCEGQPAIELVKEGEKVTRLIFTCGCGKRLEVYCLYQPGT